MPDPRRAWAKALFLAMGTAGAREGAALALDRAATLVSGEAATFFLDPAVPRKARTEALASLFGEGEGREAFGRFVDLLVEKSRVALLPLIARSYRALLDAELGISRVDLVSARPLEKATLSEIEGAWKARTKARTVIMRVSQDPALLGGFILRTGSVRYDWSTAGRFKRLGQELSRPIEAARD
jgi:F-type H+-transporting ATPase subunit delta